MRRNFLILNGTLVSIIFLLTGCFASNPKDIEAFLKPYQADVTSDSYILQPPDEIEIFCSKVPEIHLNRQTIRPDGIISFESIGEFRAVGKTPELLAADIQEKVSQFYVLSDKKQINVLISAYRSKKYFVLGQVYLPGPKTYTGRDTVVNALAEAKLNPMAWGDRIQIVRPSNNINVKPKIFEVKYRDMVALGDQSKNVLLQEGDVVYVPATPLAWVGLKIEELIRPIARAFSGVYIMQQGTEGPQTGSYR